MPRGCHHRAPTSPFLSHPRPWKRSCHRGAGQRDAVHVPVLPQEAAAPRGALSCQGRAARASSPAPTPLRPLSPCRARFLPPDGTLSPWPRSSLPQSIPGAPIPAQNHIQLCLKGDISIQPPPPPPAPGGRWQRKEGAGGTSWSCGVPAGSPRPPVPVLPRLLAGPQARARAGPGHLVSGRGSAELRVAPTHAAAESPGTPSRGTGPAPAAAGRRETLLVLRRGHGDGRAGCPRAAVPGHSHLRRARTGLGWGRGGRRMATKAERLSERKSDRKASSQPSKTVTQTDGLYIRSIKRCQPTPLARECREKP